MSYTKPNNSKKAVGRAGDVLLTGQTSTEEYDAALGVINNWRASHLYPLQAIKNTLADRARKIDKTSITVQRLKRLQSIETKLRLLGNSRLGGMQDIGGCRAIMKSVAQVSELVGVYDEAQKKNPQGRPEWIDIDDYILTPRDTGYRSVHIIMRYQSQAENCLAWNGLKIEIQIRSRLQHIWATAVETAATFLGEPLKSGQGNPKWVRFFVLASSVFAISEDCEPVPNTPTNERKLVEELNELWNELQVDIFLQGCIVTTELAQRGKKKYDRFIVILNSKELKITVQSYEKNEVVKAAQDLFELERDTVDKPEIQAVLVEIDDLAKLPVAYPNYYADTNEFIDAVRNGIIRGI